MNIVAHNMLAMNASRQYQINTKSKAKSAEKLSSGYKINRASDDAAGLSISEKMRRQIHGLNQGTENTQDGVSLCQVADGALAEVNNMLHRITELSVQSFNGTNTDSDKEAIQGEISQILKEINRIGDTTTFNEIPLFYEETNTELSDEELFQQLSNGTIKLVDNDVTFSNGEILGKDTANQIIGLLSNATASYKLKDCLLDSSSNKSDIISYATLCNNNIKALSAYSANASFNVNVDSALRYFSDGLGLETKPVSPYPLHESSTKYNNALRIKNRNSIMQLALSGMQEIVDTVRASDKYGDIMDAITVVQVMMQHGRKQLIFIKHYFQKQKKKIMVYGFNLVQKLEVECFYQLIK